MEVLRRNNDNVQIVKSIKRFKHFYFQKPPGWLSGRAFPSHAGDLGSIPGQDRPKSLGKRCECRGSLEMAIIKSLPVSQ